MKVISILNHKGGTGKTTCSINIGAQLVRSGKKVLLIDFDAQANLSQGLGIFDEEETVYTSLSRNLPLKVISRGDLDVIPSSLDLAGLETELSNKMAREFILKKAIEPLKESYDYIIIDCPPSLGIMTINCLLASDKVIVPLEAEFFAFKGIDTIIDVIRKVNENFDREIDLCAVILNEYNPRKKLTQSIEAELRSHLKETILESRLRTNVAISESQINGQHIFEYDPLSNGAKDFEKIVSELLTTNKI